jgi:hypothetical protein
MKGMDSAKRGACVLALTLVSPAGAEETVGITQCAQLEDSEQRLECYDAASRRQPAADAGSVPAPVPAPGTSDSESQEVYSPLTEEMGNEQLDPEDRKDTKPVRATVTECRQGPTDKWFFYFENGQVWKQKGSDRLRFKDCTFDVTITKDWFGYRMELVDGSAKFRVGRVK